MDIQIIHDDGLVSHNGFYLINLIADAFQNVGATLITNESGKEFLKNKNCPRQLLCPGKSGFAVNSGAV